MKIQHVHLALAHIEHEFHDDLVINDPYIEKIKDEVRKKESILARQLLNSLCEINVGRSLHQLDFRKTNQGQPVINDGFCSISHTHGWVLVGISKLPFGLDIERVEQQEIDSLSVAFDHAHWDELRGHEQQIIADFSAKEAISKGRGTGFLVDPKTIKLEADEFITQQHFQIKNDENYIISLCTTGKPHMSFDKLNKLCKFVTNYED